VYGLDLVVARPAIYVIDAPRIARVDKVVAGAAVHLIVAFAREDLVASAPSEEAVVAVGPNDPVVAGGAGDLRRVQGAVVGEQRGGHHYQRSYSDGQGVQSIH